MRKKCEIWWKKGIKINDFSLNLFFFTPTFSHPNFFRCKEKFAWNLHYISVKLYFALILFKHFHGRTYSSISEKLNVFSRIITLKSIHIPLGIFKRFFACFNVVQVRCSIASSLTKLAFSYWWCLLSSLIPENNGMCEKWTTELGLCPSSYSILKHCNSIFVICSNVHFCIED